MIIPFILNNESSKLPHTSYLIMNKFRGVCCIYNGTILRTCSQTHYKRKSPKVSDILSQNGGK